MARAPRKTKAKADETTGQSDPRAALDWQAFLAAAAPVMKTLKADLAERVKASPAMARALALRHEAEVKERRTAEGMIVWQASLLAQVAAAWLLSCVFVRTLEDRGLLGHKRIAGAGAGDSFKLFLELAPSLNERDYLLTVFRELQRFPATQGLFDARHNPVWLVTPSAEGAKALLALFAAPRQDAPAFRFGQTDTAFLGWIYQDLDEDVRARFALLQTPRFVESFILDRTLEPALEKFGLDDTTLIDPTCGSGHFLLGAFDRLFERRLVAEPDLGVRVAAFKALDAVYGADLNPYAVAIARFRLTLAFFERAGLTRLEGAPVPPLHVVVADSLLHNPNVLQGDLADIAPSSEGWRGEEFKLENEAEARAVLHRQYAAVVGNPPYITVKDAVLRERYRELYPRSVAGNYSVAAPFTERFFLLAKQGGRVGMITANSFMKREFGKKLIEQYLPSVNLDLVINTSGAYIPGHGTPTVLLFGSHEPPHRSEVLTVLANRGEPSTPDNPEQGLVWRSIEDHWSTMAFENDFISVATTSRDVLKRHPWSLGGGGAAELKELLEERAANTLSDLVDVIGFSTITGEDNVLLNPAAALVRNGVEPSHVRRSVVGEEVRDWSISTGDSCVWPNDDHGSRLSENEIPDVLRYLWPWRAGLRGRKAFGVPVEQKGIPWWALREVYSARMKTPLTITFPFVATHNHFVLDRGGKVFNRTAPIIKLPATATEDDHLALLAYLNSSTACFWMKQVLHNKGYGADSANARTTAESWQDFYEFTGTRLADTPLPPEIQKLAALGRQMDMVAQQRAATSPRMIVNDWRASQERPDSSLRRLLDVGDALSTELGEQMQALQEAIDTVVYKLFGIEESKEARKPFETPDFKRQWEHVDRRAQRVEAIQIALLDVIEDRTRALTRSADLLGKATSELSILLELARDHGIGDIARLVDRSSTPYLVQLRKSESGLAKRAEWERTWDLQRREDAGEKIDHIPVPPKYAQADYRSPSYWQLRGPLDVPKERFIAYPGCESDHDNEPIYGWAGWDHEQRAKALATLYWNRKTEESWEVRRLTPMLAGLLELLPWLQQWHGEPSDDYGGDSAAAYYGGFLDTESRALGLTFDDLRAWRPPDKARGRKAPAAKKPKKGETNAESGE